MDITLEQLEKFLISKFPEYISPPIPLKGGMFSKAFAFKTRKAELVIRINADETDFLKDQYACDQFRNIEPVPIPMILEIGRLKDRTHYAISELCPGLTHDMLEKKRLPTAIPNVIKTLAAIHQTDISHTRGFGPIQPDGHGRFSSWAASLQDFNNHKFDYTPENLFKTSFLERDVYTYFLDEFKQLLPRLPEERCLLHGDFGFDNLILAEDGSRVTGVLDWAEICCGDPLYDLAYLEFWSSDPAYAAEYRKQTGQLVGVQKNFEQRMRAYLLRIGLGSMLISAHLHNQREYIRVRERSYSALLPSRSSSTDWTQES